MGSGNLRRTTLYTWNCADHTVQRVHVDAKNESFAARIAHHRSSVKNYGANLAPGKPTLPDIGQTHQIFHALQPSSVAHISQRLATVDNDEPFPLRGSSDIVIIRREGDVTVMRAAVLVLHLCLEFQVWSTCNRFRDSLKEGQGSKETCKQNLSFAQGLGGSRQCLHNLQVPC